MKNDRSVLPSKCRARDECVLDGVLHGVSATAPCRWVLAMQRHIDVRDRSIRAALDPYSNPAAARRAVRASLRVEIECVHRKRTRRRVMSIAAAAVSIGFALLLLLDRGPQQVAARQRPPSVKAPGGGGAEPTAAS